MENKMCTTKVLAWRKGLAIVSVNGRMVGTVEKGDWGPFGRGWAAVSLRNQDVADPVVSAGVPVRRTRREAVSVLAGEA
jgi:hypothetical protein